MLSMLLTVIRQNGNKVWRNAFHPSVVNGVLRMRMSYCGLEPVSWIEKHLVIKFVAVRVNAGDDVVIIFLELVGPRLASGVQFFLPKIVQKLSRMRMAAHDRQRDFVIKCRSPIQGSLFNAYCIFDNALSTGVSLLLPIFCLDSLKHSQV